MHSSVHYALGLALDNFLTILYGLSQEWTFVLSPLSVSNRSLCRNKRLSVNLAQLVGYGQSPIKGDVKSYLTLLKNI